MKQIKIIVALVAGLFAFTTANAGEMTVTGAMHATYQSEQTGVTGNPLGMNTDLKFSGSQDTDFGAVTWSMATDGVFLGGASGDGADSKMSLVSSYGTFRIGNTGDSANAVDDITPTAFEEANGSGSGTYAQDFGSGLEGSMGLGYAYADILGSGVSLDYTYYPKLDGTTNNEKSASGGGNSTANSAQSANIKIANPATPGLEVTLGYEISENRSSTFNNKEGGTVAVNYATGPVKVGYQRKLYQTLATTNDDTYYKDDIVGIAYAINDALAVSYNVIKSEKTAELVVEVEQTTKAINAAYTVGGLTIGFQDAKTEDAGYVTSADDDTRTLSLKTAF
jgi:hypothetical protein